MVRLNRDGQIKTLANQVGDCPRQSSFSGGLQGPVGDVSAVVGAVEMDSLDSFIRSVAR